MHSTSSPEAIARVASKIPKGTWCSHMHILDPVAFPLSAEAKYTPAAHTMEDARAFFDPLGIKKMVVVQPSIYGNDNACTLSAMPDLGPQDGRAVIQFDPRETSPEQLQKWHDEGVRGVRLNFKSVGADVTQEELAAMMQSYADAVRPLGWIIELYIAMESIPLLQAVAPAFDDVRICIDHFGHPSAPAMASYKKATELPGWDAFATLLKQPNVWCKLSASYRLSKDPRDPLVGDMCREILKLTDGERCVFATDWPHTRFEDIDVLPFVEATIDSIQQSGVSVEKLLVQNADQLWA
ncbi:amidohydrolase 2 [Polychaeton citri CBS 116435]|uniref:Amidohydrolase 2 n=1 Tax=Polychaeton citri CBS 116435 TaxID=1314669 RepID=A0A9P4QG59_9PEZI|nr:amidohydrolase 2 [Polychaeton citri CBS 116435]